MNRFIKFEALYLEKIDQGALSLYPQAPSNPTLLQEAPSTSMINKMNENTPKAQELHQWRLGFCFWGLKG